MGIVMNSRANANTIRDYCDNVFTQICNGKPLHGHSDLTISSILGVVTLEDVIERQLRVDITDEKDRDNAKLKLQRENSFSSHNLKLELSKKYSVQSTEDLHLGHNEDGIY
jgi:hypothetical protein